MATEQSGPPPTVVGDAQPDQKSAIPQAPSKNEKKPKAEAGADPNAKLTGAQLKAKAKAEKAARRAQVKTNKDQTKGEAAISSSPAQLGPSAGEVKGAKAKGKQEGAAAVGGSAAAKAAVAKGAMPAVVSEPKLVIPECFSHLSMARRIPMTQADKDVHPTVLALGQQMATFAIDESILRLKATLLAFKKVKNN